MIRVLSMWQPWASLTCTVDPDRGDFAKRYETRHWRPTARHSFPCYRDAAGRFAFKEPLEVAIHATLRDETTAIVGDELHGVVVRCGLEHSRPRGAIIAIAQVPFIIRTDDLEDRFEEIVGDWTPGRFAWLLENVHALDESIPLKGRQDVLWTLPPEIEARVREQVAA